MNISNKERARQSATVEIMKKKIMEAFDNYYNSLKVILKDETEYAKIKYWFDSLSSSNRQLRDMVSTMWVNELISDKMHDDLLKYGCNLEHDMWVYYLNKVHNN